MNQYKTCLDCKQVKSFDEFHNNKKIKDGKAQYCKPCLLARGKSYRNANPEKVKETNRISKNKNKTKASITRKVWRDKNKEKINAQKRKLRLEKPEHYRQLARKQYAKNPESALNNAVKRYARLKSVKTYAITSKELRQLRQKNCHYCGSKKQIELDHVIPINRNGTHGIGNLVPACRKCNRSKSESFIMEWRIRLKREAG